MSLSLQFVLDNPDLNRRLMLQPGPAPSGLVSSTQTAGVIQAQRVTTGSILASATSAVTLTWTAAFADANYTPVASVVDSTGNLAAVDIASFNATQVVVNVKNNDGANPHTGTLCVMAMHD